MPRFWLTWITSGLCLFIWTLALFMLATGAEEIRIGVLLRHPSLEQPLNRSLETLKENASILPNSKLKAIVEIIDSDNSYQASAAVCRLISQNVWTIIGPQSVQIMPIVQAITSYYHIPLVIINWQPQTYYIESFKKDSSGRHITDQLESEIIPPLLNYAVNIYPTADQLSQAYLDMIRHKNWKSFSLIYDTSEDFMLVKNIFEASFADTNINIQKVRLDEDDLDEFPDVLEEFNFESNSSSSASLSLSPFSSPLSSSSSSASEDDHDVDIRQEYTNPEYCDFDHTEISLSYKKLMKDLRKRGAENIVLSMPLDKVCKILKEASNVGLLTIYNDYIIANLDAHLLNLTGFQPFITNISAYSILDPEGQQTDFTLSKKWLGKRPSEIPKKHLSTEYSMISDAISLIALSIDELISDPKVGKSVSKPTVDCGASEAWEYGERLMNIFKGSDLYGAYTGNLKFDKFGQRVNFNLDYILHKNNTFKKVGTWNIKEKLEDKTKHLDDFGLQAIKNKTLTVTVARTTPYVMYKDDYTNYTGNDKYEGYCIDLLNKLAKKLQFNYVIKEVSDGQYGKIQNGSWTGMIKELLDWQADLAIVDLTITKERQSAVDFTHPFMTLGIAILYKKPKMEEAELYSFLMPLSKEVWLSMSSAYVCISLAFWLVSRLSPLEWKNPHPCQDNPDDRDLENEMHSIGASLWFTIGSLMQQGSDLAPKSMSVRSLASVWYFFTLILISSYTANFAAFLTASRMQSPIESADDLSKQTKIDYGCKEGGSTQAFFASSNHSTYRRMWNFMESRKHQGVFPNDNMKGINMTKKGNYAFLMESTSIDYMVQRNCELTQIGGLLDHKGYGIALRKRSPYRAPLSKSIVELNEAGELQDLKNKWWNLPQPACEEEKDLSSATSELGIDKVGGVFVMLIVGSVLTCIAALLEFIWKSLKKSKDQRDSILHMFWRELVRTCTCGASKRPASTDTTYNHTNSHPSMSNLNNSANSLNKGNYMTRLADGSIIDTNGTIYQARSGQYSNEA